MCKLSSCIDWRRQVDVTVYLRSRRRSGHIYGYGFFLLILKRGILVVIVSYGILVAREFAHGSFVMPAMKAMANKFCASVMQ